MTNEEILNALKAIKRVDCPEITGGWSAPAGKYLDPKDPEVQRLAAAAIANGAKPNDVANWGAAATAKVEFDAHKNGKASTMKTGRLFQMPDSVRKAAKGYKPVVEAPAEEPQKEEVAA